MDNHPIPQNVTGFEFKLIGDMTLRQFAYLAGGSLLAYLTYLLPLPFFIKWPLVVLLAILGFSFAFVPISGRPIDRMFFNFLKALFSENQYVFRQTPTVGQYVKTEPPPMPQEPKQVIKQPVSQQGGQISAAPQPLPRTSPHTPVPPITAAIMPPSLLKHPVDLRMQPQKLPPPPLKEKSRTELKTAPPELVFPSNVIEQPTPAVTARRSAALPPQFAKPTPTQTPSFPNLIRGIVEDGRGDVVPGVIVEVKDKSGLALRAFKTNKLGQFASSTPLPDGTYMIELEDPLNRFAFTPILLTLDEKEIPPLEIKPIDQQEGLRKELFGTN